MIEHSIWLASYNVVMDTAAKIKLGHERYVPEYDKYKSDRPTANSLTVGSFGSSELTEGITTTAGRQGRTAVVNVRDGMVHRAEWWHKYMGITSYESIVQALREAETDPNIDSILLHMDTPGGMVSGLESVTDTMSKMSKPIIAYTDGIMASAGYWIGSNATLTLASPMSTIGSVGALVIRQDITKMLDRVGVKMEIYRAGDNKARMNPFEDMREEDQKALLADLAEAYQEFLSKIAEGRDGKVSRVGLEELTEHGRTFYGKTALSKNLIDGTASLVEVLEEMDEKINNNADDPISTLG